MKSKFTTVVDQICEQDIRYKEEAYLFVMEALSYTQKKYKAAKHVNGPELLEGIRELLINKYGPLTITVLNYWGIQVTDDFGHIIFNLIGRGILSKSENDTMEAFHNAYDFKDAFLQGYRKQLHKKISRMRSF